MPLFDVCRTSVPPVAPEMESLTTWILYDQMPCLPRLSVSIYTMFVSAFVIRVESDTGTQGPCAETSDVGRIAAKAAKRKKKIACFILTALFAFLMWKFYGFGHVDCLNDARRF